MIVDHLVVGWRQCLTIATLQLHAGTCQLVDIATAHHIPVTSHDDSWISAEIADRAAGDFVVISITNDRLVE